MIRQRQFECRFGVGDPNGKHSMVWKVWASRNTPDVYVTARSLRGAMKASIHASGERHVGLTSERALDKTKRHYDRWFGGHKLDEGISLEFLIQIPTAELRCFWLDAKDLKSNVVWLPPSPGKTMSIAVLLLAPQRQPVGRDEQHLIAQGTLSDLRQVWVMHSSAADKTLTTEASWQEKRKMLLSAGIDPSSMDDVLRLILGINYDGVRSFTEIAPSSLQRSSF
jgi:hypothetical protein